MTSKKKSGTTKREKNAPMNIDYGHKILQLAFRWQENHNSELSALLSQVQVISAVKAGSFQPHAAVIPSCIRHVVVQYNVEGFRLGLQAVVHGSMGQSA